MRNTTLRLAAALILAGGFAPSAPAFAQQAAAAGSAQPVPDALELAKLVWSTMTAIDHANQSGNYSVLRDIAAPGFQINNDPARLAQIFAPIRASGVDLSNTLLLGPTYSAPAAIVGPGVMRVQGYFGLRPTAIGFDFYFQWIGGRWRLYGVSITPRSIAAVQPAPAGTSPPRAAAPPRR